MKVLIATEFLHERNWITTHLEEILRLYPQAVLMSLTFKKGAFGSPIESHTVISSSGDAKTLKKHKWMALPLVQKLKVPSDIGLVITFSQGYMHHLKVPKGCVHLSYFLGRRPEKNFFQRLLQLPLKPRITKAFAPYGKLQKDWNAYGPEILPPFFKIGEHEFDGLREISREINYIFHIGEKTDFDFEKLKREWKLEKFLFLGKEKTLDKFMGNSSLRTEHCYEEGCSGTQQKLFENSRVFIDLTGEDFNPLLMQSLCAGMGVYAPSFYREILTDEFALFFEKEPEKESLLKIESFEKFDRRRGRRQALRYNGRVFKKRFQKIISTSF